MLALAEDYLGAAKQLGPRAADGRDPNDLKRYHKLVATSLGCLESVLQVSDFGQNGLHSTKAYSGCSDGDFRRIEKL